MFSLPVVELSTLYNQEKMGSWESQLPSDELGVMVQGGGMAGGRGWVEGWLLFSHTHCRILQNPWCFLLLNWALPVEGGLGNSKGICLLLKLNCPQLSCLV